MGRASASVAPETAPRVKRLLHDQLWIPPPNPRAESVLMGDIFIVEGLSKWGRDEKEGSEMGR